VYPPSLIAVWIGVAIIPIVPLYAVMLPRIDDITPVVYHQVMPVGVVFVSVPVVVVMMVPVVDSDLDVLSFGLDYNDGLCSNHSSQEQ
jgi:hypothetical protein